MIHGPDGTGWKSPLERTLPAPVVGLAYDASGNGYWLATADGAVYTVGDAPNLGSPQSLGLKLSKPIVGIASTPTRKGFYLFGADGGVFCFGDASFVGSVASIPLNKPIVGMAGG